MSDTDAVAPGSLTSWKESLFVELYARATEELLGDAPVSDEEARGRTARALRQRLSRVRRGLAGSSAHGDALSYLESTAGGRGSPRARKSLDASGVRGGTPEGRGLTQFTIFTRTGVTRASSRRSPASGAEVPDRGSRHRDARGRAGGRHVRGGLQGEPPAQLARRSGGPCERVLLASGRWRRSSPHGDSSARPAQRGCPRGGSTTPADGRPLWRCSPTTARPAPRSRGRCSSWSCRSLGEISTSLDQVADVFYVTDKGGANRRRGAWIPSASVCLKRSRRHARDRVGLSSEEEERDREEDRNQDPHRPRHVAEAGHLHLVFLGDRLL